eukprot:TRINITY_DN1830_c0_g1_i3.p1 TRINITY_DN1830_c0_g1~~TRINITY_DN1830_c0_g1_i3.p1  ORF type:complete len:460 (-),score=108.10 TRINITY_DN1830_c0_g1_i3:32-1411(-)
MISTLHAISPLDGRYWGQVSSLADYFSEYALIKYRVHVEVEYFISLCEIDREHMPQLAGFDRTDESFSKLRNIYQTFSDAEAMKIKELEKITNHDVKAVEYFIKEKFDQNGWQAYKEFIHFGLTSQDVNNTAIPLSLKDFSEKFFWGNVLGDLIQNLKKRAKEWEGIPLLARTHGQPASPTTVGKEIYVFIERLQYQIDMLKNIPFAAKFGGATGNFNAHYISFPSIDWIDFSNKFTTKLGLKRMQYTTQIEHYDHLAAMLDCCKRINTILIDLVRDMWTYISMEYFTQSIQKGEVGSSAMPHKVNPIDFENAEGNFGISNALFEHLSAKLPVSRLQRDLTDSTVLRNLGVPFSHSVISIKSLLRGLAKLSLNEDKLRKDLEDNWPVVSEAIQTILRREGYDKPYEALKDLTRVGKEHGKITQQTFEEFINGLKTTEKVKAELRAITPLNYTGKHPQFS